MMDLLDALAGEWSDAPEWVIIGTWGRCGLCGTKCGFNQGGSRTGAVCDDCAEIDGCRLVCCEPVVERRRAHVGHEREECAHCACGWWAFVDHWTDDGEWAEYTPAEVTDMLAAHAEPRHVSHWGRSHHPSKHDDLVKAQARRRRIYLSKEHAS